MRFRRSTLPFFQGGVRFDELLCDAVVSTYGAQRPPVGPGVVGHQPLDPGDSVRGEVGDRPGEELGAGGALLVGQDLAVGQPGVVVDERVDVVVADLDLLACRGGAHLVGRELNAAHLSRRLQAVDP